jgi:hypothetical protein
VTPEQKSKLSKRSRSRGKRAEYGLRNYLRSLNWLADRVPSSGASQGFPGDVKGTPPPGSGAGERSVLFEVKNHTGKFAQFWVLLDRWQREAKNDLLSVAVPGAEHLCCDISTSLEAVFDSDGVYTLTNRHPLYKDFKSSFDRLPTLCKLVKGADVLVLKDNGRPWIFLRFR